MSDRRHRWCPVTAFDLAATKIVIEVRTREIQGKGRMQERVWLLFLGLLRYIHEMRSLHVELVEEIRNKTSRARPTTHMGRMWVVGLSLDDLFFIS